MLLAAAAAASAAESASASTGWLAAAPASAAPAAAPPFITEFSQPCASVPPPETAPAVSPEAPEALEALEARLNRVASDGPRHSPASGAATATSGAYRLAAVSAARPRA